MTDIIVGNLVFWPVWLYVGSIPYRLMQKVIDTP